MDLMDSGVQLTFLWRLVKGTQEGTVKWEPVPGTSNFRCRIGRFGYVISSRDADDLPPYLLDIYRFDQPADAPSVQVTSWSTEDMPNIADALQSLFIEAKRRVLGYDSLVNDMFEDLAAVDGGPPAADIDSSEPQKGF